jgi:glycosyltransferase involved in cell wall biosynthesis
LRGVVRVLFVNTATLPPLGADTWIHVQIMRHLDRSTHELYAACARGRRDAPTPTYEALRRVPELHVITVDFGPELAGRSRWGKLVGLAQALRAPIGLMRLAALIRRRRIDVIHTSDRPRDALACVLLSKLTRRPCIVHLHVSYNMWMSGMLRWSLHRADHLVAVSQFVADSLTSNGIPPGRVHVVLNAIDVAAWQPGRGRDATRAELGVPADAPVLLTVCRLFPEKGPADVIRALARAREELPGIRLLIAGTDVTPNGQFGIELHALVRRLDLESAVHFLGRRPDIEGLMAAADVYVMPSFEEPFGLVFVEAMAMGLPVVALDNGGTREVVEHEHSGLLSERGDIEALSANLLMLLRNPTLRARMGEYGRRRAAERFTAQRMAADAAVVYASIA